VEHSRPVLTGYPRWKLLIFLVPLDNFVPI
jgi:hypothetical protein